jgi:hypothetical protein
VRKGNIREALDEGELVGDLAALVCDLVLGLLELLVRGVGVEGDLEVGVSDMEGTWNKTAYVVCGRHVGGGAGGECACGIEGAGCCCYGKTESPTHRYGSLYRQSMGLPPPQSPAWRGFIGLGLPG